MPTEPTTVLGPYVQGEIPDPIVVIFEDVDGNKLDLTGYTSPQWKTRRHRFTAGFPFDALDPAAVIRTAVINPNQTTNKGEAAYTWVAGDMSIAGDYEATMWVTGPSGTPIRATTRYAYHVALDLINPNGVPDPGPDGSLTVSGLLTAPQILLSGGARITSGSGPPNIPNGVNPGVGDLWIRTGTPTIGGQRLYMCSVGGANPTWVALI